MFKNIFLFELKYRKARAANYIYFAIMFLLSIVFQNLQILYGNTFEYSYP